MIICENGTLTSIFGWKSEGYINKIKNENYISSIKIFNDITFSIRTKKNLFNMEEVIRL